MQLDQNRLNRVSEERKQLDNHTCCNCGYHKKSWLFNRDLDAHHIFSKKHYKKYAYSVDKIRTLCETCHTSFHTRWMSSYSDKCTDIDYYLWRMNEEVVKFRWLFKLFRKLIRVI